MSSCNQNVNPEDLTIYSHSILKRVRTVKEMLEGSNSIIKMNLEFSTNCYFKVFHIVLVPRLLISQNISNSKPMPKMNGFEIIFSHSSGVCHTRFPSKCPIMIDSINRDKGVYEKSSIDFFKNTRGENQNGIQYIDNMNFVTNNFRNVTGNFYVSNDLNKYYNIKRRNKIGKRSRFDQIEDNGIYVEKNGGFTNTREQTLFINDNNDFNINGNSGRQISISENLGMENGIVYGSAYAGVTKKVQYKMSIFTHCYLGNLTELFVMPVIVVLPLTKGIAVDRSSNSNGPDGYYSVQIYVSNPFIQTRHEKNEMKLTKLESSPIIIKAIKSKTFAQAETFYNLLDTASGHILLTDFVKIGVSSLLIDLDRYKDQNAKNNISSFVAISPRSDKIKNKNYRNPLAEQFLSICRYYILKGLVSESQEYNINNLLRGNDKVSQLTLSASRVLSNLNADQLWLQELVESTRRKILSLKKKNINKQKADNDNNNNNNININNNNDSKSTKSNTIDTSPSGDSYNNDNTNNIIPSKLNKNDYVINLGNLLDQIKRVHFIERDFVNKRRLEEYYPIMIDVKMPHDGPNHNLLEFSIARIKEINMKRDISGLNCYLHNPDETKNLLFIGNDRYQPLHELSCQQSYRGNDNNNNNNDSRIVNIIGNIENTNTEINDLRAINNNDNDNNGVPDKEQGNIPLKKEFNTSNNSNSFNSEDKGSLEGENNLLALSTELKKPHNKQDGYLGDIISYINTVAKYRKFDNMSIFPSSKKIPKIDEVLLGTIEKYSELTRDINSNDFVLRTNQNVTKINSLQNSKTEDKNYEVKQFLNKKQLSEILNNSDDNIEMLDDEHYCKPENKNSNNVKYLKNSSNSIEASATDCLQNNNIDANGRIVQEMTRQNNYIGLRKKEEGDKTDNMIKLNTYQDCVNLYSSKMETNGDIGTDDNNTSNIVKNLSETNGCSEENDLNRSNECTDMMGERAKMHYDTNYSSYSSSTSEVSLYGEKNNGIIEKLDNTSSSNLLQDTDRKDDNVTSLPFVESLQLNSNQNTSNTHNSDDININNDRNNDRGGPRSSFQTNIDCLEVPMTLPKKTTKQDEANSGSNDRDSLSRKPRTASVGRTISHYIAELQRGSNFERSNPVFVGANPKDSPIQSESFETDERMMYKEFSKPYGLARKEGGNRERSIAMLAPYICGRIRHPGDV